LYFNSTTKSINKASAVFICIGSITGVQVVENPQKKDKLMQKDFSIEGVYYLENNKLIPTDKTKPELIIRHRKTPVRGKPSAFLAIHKPEFKYISSLFDDKNNQSVATKSYELDYTNTKYKLTFTPDNSNLKARIEQF
jgi:hypothetical protein